MRIAMGGIAIESCTFSPLPSRLADFTLARGAEFLGRYPFLSQLGAEFVPLLYARALPGGSVVPEAYAQIKAEFLQLLAQQGPFDGIYLDLHGACHVQGMDDAEGDWISAVRAAAGPDCLIAASYDLHGNVSRRQVEALDLLTAYRTAPHVDVVATREKALRLLLHCLQTGIRPLRAWIPIPVVLPGEKTSTEWEPGASLYAFLKEIDPLPGVLDASLLVGYVWADEPRSSATVIVTGTERDVIEDAARRIAQRYWAARTEFRFGSWAGSIEDCIQRALAAPQPCVFISDSGDNPTAGGVGDTPVFLERLLALNVPDAVVASIADEAATTECFAAGVGATVHLSLGGKLDPITSPPLLVRGVVRHLEEGDNRQVVVQIDGIHVIVTQRRRPYHLIKDFQDLGIEPTHHKIVVVKIGYLEPDLKRAAPLALMALSPGAVDQAIERLPFKRIGRPIYPLDPEMEWSC